MIQLLRLKSVFLASQLFNFSKFIIKTLPFWPILFSFRSFDFTGDAGAEIEISPSGEFLYVSNRGNGAIVVFKIMPDFPFLDRIQVQYLGGPTPRHFKVLILTTYLVYHKN